MVAGAGDPSWGCATKTMEDRPLPGSTGARGAPRSIGVRVREFGRNTEDTNWGCGREREVEC